MLSKVNSANPQPDPFSGLSQENVLNVLVETNDSGPIGDDYFVVVTLLNGEQIRLPIDQKPLLDALISRLPDYDYHAEIEAAGSTEDRWFVCWNKVRPRAWFAFSVQNLKKRFDDLLAAINPHCDRRSVVDEVFANLSQAHRFYHTLRHVHDLLVELDSLETAPSNPQAIELAIWYHDIVYNPKAQDNEAKSVALFRRHCHQLGMASETVELVSAMIMATTHQPMNEIKSSDVALFLDLDLSILSADPFRFCAYEKNVWLEFRHVPWPLRAYFRKRLLKRFLKSPIYRTEAFQPRESTARELIATILASWPRYRWMIG
jgi:predicted metal-dependent HD superfamily phosphohydrolase